MTDHCKNCAREIFQNTKLVPGVVTLHDWYHFKSYSGPRHDRLFCDPSQTTFAEPRDADA